MTVIRDSQPEDCSWLEESPHLRNSLLCTRGGVARRGDFSPVHTSPLLPRAPLEPTSNPSKSKRAEIDRSSPTTWFCYDSHG